MSFRMWMLAGSAAMALVACGEKKEEAAVEEAQIASTAEIESEARAQADAMAAAAQKRAEDILAENAERDGVKVTETGLQYETIIAGTGASPKSGDNVTIHYVGTLSDGSEFDSSVARNEPLTFPIDEAVEGWREGIMLMKEGGKTKVMMPPVLAYGATGTSDGRIGPFEVVTLELQLIEVIAADDKKRLEEVQQAAVERYKERQKEEMAARVARAEANAVAAEQFLEENGKKDGIQTTLSGLQYEVLNKGEGKVSPGPRDMVEVHYHGTRLDGSVFDSSVLRGETSEFPLNRVISGWTEGLQLMQEGDKFRFYIRPDLAYGPMGKGDIGPNELLVFEVELFDVKGKGAAKKNG